MNEQWPWVAAVLITIGLIGGIVYFDGQSTATSSSTTVPEEIMTVAEGEWVKGNPSAPVTIIEYSDFQCPACGHYYPILKELLSKDGEKIRFVYRHFPLTNLHPNAEGAARATEAAGLQGKFWEMHDQVFEHQGDWAPAKDPTELFESYAKTIGLNLDQFRSDRTSNDVKNAVESDRTSGNHAGADSTPTFVINGERLLKNPTTVAAFETIIQEKTDATKTPPTNQ